MKSILIMKNWQFNIGECGTHCVGVFINMNQAKEKFLELVEQARKDMKGFEYDEETIDENNLSSWSIWEKDEYCYNHIDLVIEEINIPISAKEFYKEEIEDYISQLREDEYSDFPELTDEELENIYDSVANELMSDDDVWDKLNEGIDYYVWHNDIIMNKRGV